MYFNKHLIATSNLTAGCLLHALELSIITSNLAADHRLHALLLDFALTHHTLLANRLVDLYSKSNALQAFHNLPFKNLYSYNTLLATLSRATRLNLACHLFTKNQPSLLPLDAHGPPTVPFGNPNLEFVRGNLVWHFVKYLVGTVSGVGNFCDARTGAKEEPWRQLRRCEDDAQFDKVEEIEPPLTAMPFSRLFACPNVL